MDAGVPSPDRLRNNKPATKPDPRGPARASKAPEPYPCAAAAAARPIFATRTSNVNKVFAAMVAPHMLTGSRTQARALVTLRQRRGDHAQARHQPSLLGLPMITCNPHEMSVVNIASLSPGDLFIYAEAGRKFTAVVVDHADEPRFISWLHLTGAHPFTMDCVRGPCSDVRDGKVLRLALKLGELRLQVTESAISLKPPAIGSLFIDESPRIVTAFLSVDGSGPEADLWAVSLHDLSRHRLGHGFTCDRWRLVGAPGCQTPEVFASFPGGAEIERPSRAAADPAR